MRGKGRYCGVVDTSAGVWAGLSGANVKLVSYLSRIK